MVIAHGTRFRRRAGVVLFDSTGGACNALSNCVIPNDWQFVMDRTLGRSR